MDYRAPVETFLGQDPLNLRDVARENVFPLETLQAIAPRPDYYGFQRIGETATDRDVIRRQDVRLQQRILMDSVGVSEDPTDHTFFLIPVVLYRGLSSFSVIETVAEAAVLDRCTATSELSGMGMYKISREYSGQMYGGAIDLSAELLQRGTADEIRYIFNLKVKQMISSLQMTFRHVVYANLFAGPPLEFAELRKAPATTKRDLFFGRFDKRIDNFLAWNFKRTDPQAVLLDLDNSLTFDGSVLIPTAPDVFVLHPILMNCLRDRFVESNYGVENRQIYYHCINHNKATLDESDLKPLEGAEKYVAPRFKIYVNGQDRFVIKAPNITENNVRSNPSELEAHFKCFVLIGTNPPRSAMSYFNLETVQAIDWNTVYVTDLDRGVDSPVRLLEVMTQGGYFHEDSYNPTKYNQLMDMNPALVKLKNALSPETMFNDTEGEYDTARVSVLFRPSRKVYFDSRLKRFRECWTYGHSDVCVAPVDAGDVTAAMTLMRATQFSEDREAQFARDMFVAFLESCLQLPWSRNDVDALQAFYHSSFEELMNAKESPARAQLLEDVVRNGGYTHFVNYDQLLVLQDVLKCELAGRGERLPTEQLQRTLNTITRLIDFVHELRLAYIRLVARDSDHPHSWFFLAPGLNTLQKLFAGVREEEEAAAGDDFQAALQCAVLYHRLVLRLLSPHVVSAGKSHGAVRVHGLSIHDGVAHSNVNCECLQSTCTFVTRTQVTDLLRLGLDITVLSEFSPYDSWTRNRQTLTSQYDPRRDFINDNYSYRVDRTSKLQFSFAVRCFTLLFISFLQNPQTTRLLVSQNVYVNTAFMLYRGVRQRTCSVALCRSGKENRALFVGNGKRDSIETSAAAYKTNVRIEVGYMDYNEQNNTRVQHHVAGLGYVSGMGSGIFNPDHSQCPVSDGVVAATKNGDFVAVPLPSSTDPTLIDKYQPVNGRAARADGNQAPSIAQPDEIFKGYTTNPFATTGLSEASVVLGSSGHPLWNFNPEPTDGIFSMFVNAQNPAYQLKAGFDQFYRPVAVHPLRPESNVAVQDRQYVEGAQNCPLAYKTLNKGFYGKNLHSESTFKNALDVSTVRSDEGVYVMDPHTCKLSREGPVTTGMKKMYPPLRREPPGQRLIVTN